jgi:hypothetical protein
MVVLRDWYKYIRKEKHMRKKDALGLEKGVAKQIMSGEKEYRRRQNKILFTKNKGRKTDNENE